MIVTQQVKVFLAFHGTKISMPVHRSAPLDPILSQENSVHARTHSNFQALFSITILSMPRSVYFDSLVSDSNFANISHFVCLLSPVFMRPHNIFYSRNGSYEEFCLLGCNSVFSVENKPTFRRKISSPSLGLKSKPIKQPARSRQREKPGMRYIVTFSS
jgi:hypothetical protein